MEKNQTQLLKIVDVLQEVQQTCRSLLQAGNDDGAINLLLESQNSTIKMGEFIEQSQGTGTKTVSFLEEYCELLYWASVSIAEQNGKPDFDELEQALKKIRDSIQCDLIADRIEIVFFPYKASMWDSLESIWLSAANDPQCNAVVVPIPYYDKGIDGSLGEMHYEGGDYPSYVPVVNWQEYDLEARHPDVAFIHNPYDDKNFVTQVHSLYFTENLKKHVGLLCYSPYFVAIKDMNPDLAILPGVINSDFVIVQSEEIREEYLAAWANRVKKNRASISDLEKMERKILPLGSPKFDAITMNNQKNTDLPDSWKRLIENPDGTKKKVIFYNTSTVTMLDVTLDADDNISEQYLDKIESVLRFFKQRDDVVLLWRPHPFLKQTFSLLRPELYLRYLRIVLNYRQEAYGIYDDSGELHRAIAVSDAYYGDGSSVVALWQKTGKPLLISNVDITTYEQRLVARNLYFDGTYFWSTALNFNGLFQIEKDTLKIDYIGQFPHEKNEGYNLFSRITECEGKLYFSPLSAKNIGVYDKKTNEFHSIPLELKKEDRDQEKKYADAFTYGKNVFIIGSRIFSILKIDTQTDSVTVIDDWKKQVIACKNIEAPALITYGCQIREKLYFPSMYANSMFVFNMSDCSSEIHPFRAC